MPLVTSWGVPAAEVCPAIVCFGLREVPALTAASSKRLVPCKAVPVRCLPH